MSHAKKMININVFILILAVCFVFESFRFKKWPVV